MKKFSAILFGGKILEYMYNHGYNAVGLGKLINIQPGNIRGWAQGRTIPTISKAQQMLSFGINFGEFNPAITLTPKDVDVWAKSQALSIHELCDLADIAESSYWKWKRGTTSLLVSTAYELYAFMQEYGEKAKEEEPVVEEQQIVLEPIIEVEEPVVAEEEQPITEEEKIKAIFAELEPQQPTTLNYIPNEAFKEAGLKNKRQPITLRELFSWAEKYNVLDAEIGIQGKEDSVIGHSLMIDEDDNKVVYLKVG